MGETAIKKDFYVTVSSNASAKYYPSNTVSQFRNLLAEPIRLSEAAEGWEVGLVEIVMPPNRAHLELSEEDLTVKLLFSKPMMQGPKIEVRHTVTLSPFTTAMEFTVRLAGALRAEDVPEQFRGGIKLSRPLGNSMFAMTLNRYTFITFSERVLRMIGIDHKCLTDFGAIGSETEKELMCWGLVDVTAGFHSLWVYSNCCEHRAVGGVRVPLLRTIVVKSKDLEDVVHQVFTRPDYIPVSQNYLSSLEVFITDNTGSPIPFFPGESVVSLHFRPKGD